MAYKDKDKQREYQRQWVRQKRNGDGSTNGDKVRQSSTQVEGSTVTLQQPSPLENVDSYTTADTEQHGCTGCKLMAYTQGQGLSCPVGKHATGAASIFEQNVNPDSDCTARQEAC